MTTRPQPKNPLHGITLEAIVNELVETLHVTTVDVTLFAIAVHVAANLYESLRHRENMFKAMVTGQKNAPPAEPGHH